MYSFFFPSQQVFSKRFLVLRLKMFHVCWWWLYFVVGVPTTCSRPARRVLALPKVCIPSLLGWLFSHETHSCDVQDAIRILNVHVYLELACVLASFQQLCNSVCVVRAVLCVCTICWLWIALCVYIYSTTRRLLSILYPRFSQLFNWLISSVYWYMCFFLLIFFF